MGAPVDSFLIHTSIDRRPLHLFIRTRPDPYSSTLAGGRPQDIGMQPDMDLDGVEKQTVHVDTETMIRRNNRRKRACLFWCICVPLSCVLAACIVVPHYYYMVDAQYSVATGSVSGLLLDPKAAAGLSFNLTLCVASRSPGAEACINPGMFVEVFYRGVRVAASEGENQVVRRTCARPHDVAELPVVAAATALPVGQGLDTLASEMRQGTVVFDFILHVPARSYGGESALRPWMTRCKGSRVGGAAVPCDSPIQND